MNPLKRGIGAGSILCLLAILFGALALGTVAASAQTLTTLYSFTGGNDGAIPFSGLIADGAGNLYGTTAFGGTFGSGVSIAGCGVVFKLTPAGVETVLHSFTCGSDGGNPSAGLIADGAGNLYGTTPGGGPSGGPYCGVVFKLTPAGVETVLYSFTCGSDGGDPSGSLIADAAGNLYGTTLGGGALGSGVRGNTGGCGVVFKLTPAGVETVLYSFTCGNDGAIPSGGLIADSAGNLYGTTVEGGASGFGVVFKLTPAGVETVLHSFTGGSDGGFPSGSLIADSAGNLYGTTGFGGASGNGVVFKLTPEGAETVLYSFTGGDFPRGGLIADAAGNLYGTTLGGGAFGLGAVFKLTPEGAETVLYSFTGGNDEIAPSGNLIADFFGNLYGTTSGAGVIPGTVFKLPSKSIFFGIPGQRGCRFQTLSFLSTTFGGLGHAATSLGLLNAEELGEVVAAYCGRGDKD